MPVNDWEKDKFFYKNPLKFQAFWKLLEKIRINKCLEYCRGRILDIGCGNNVLVKKYGNGIGVDVFPWEGVDILYDTIRLPFRANEFDRVLRKSPIKNLN